MLRSIILILLIVLAVPGDAAGDSAGLRIATYNIRLQLASDAEAGNGWESRVGPMRRLLRFHDFDIIGLQEALRGQLDALLADSPYDSVGVGRDDGRDAGEFAPILYKRERFRRMDSGTFWLSETPEQVSFGWDATKYRRICTWVQLEDRACGRVFIVWNTHFDHEAPLARRNAALLLLSRISSKAPDRIPSILMGDLNASPESEPYRLLTAALRDTRVISETPPFGPTGTFNGFRSDQPATERIDHLFISSGFRVLRHGTLDDSFDGRFPSDHFPVVADLVWEPVP